MTGLIVFGLGLANSTFGLHERVLAEIKLSVLSNI